MKMNDDIIVAVATSRLEAAISIIRLSGKDVIAFVQQFFTGKIINKESHTITYGYIKDNGEKIDEVLVNIYRGKRTFTGEEMVEINCHGGVYITNKVVDLCLHHGARLAERGEFSKRAFLNGRIDLSQAEAVMDLIQSKNEFAMSTSLKQLEGALGKKITEIRKQIIHSVAFIESALDDPEHYSVDGFSDELREQVEKIIKQLNEFLENADNGRILKEGIQTVIVGKPNAGKSSVLNVLLGEERAIVTDIAGTTRDTLEESIQIKGIPLNIIDTAGIRDTNDLIEKIGVDKAKELLKKAGIPVVVLTQDYEDGISIIYDDYHAGKAMGEHIGKKGHQKVGYIGVYETDKAVGTERRNGVLDGLKEYGITPVIGKSDYSFLGGQTVARELLEKEPDLDAIICATDRLAFGTYKILHEYKKEIPEEVSVAAFGGYDESALLTPELTTLKFDSYGMGYLGAETILKMIAGDPVSKKQIVGYEFINGGSVR